MQILHSDYLLFLILCLLQVMVVALVEDGNSDRFSVVFQRPFIRDALRRRSKWVDPTQSLAVWIQVHALRLRCSGKSPISPVCSTRQADETRTRNELGWLVY